MTKTKNLFFLAAILVLNVAAVAGPKNQQQGLAMRDNRDDFVVPILVLQQRDRRSAGAGSALHSPCRPVDRTRPVDAHWSVSSERARSPSGPGSSAAMSSWFDQGSEVEQSRAATFAGTPAAAGAPHWRPARYSDRAAISSSLSREAIDRIISLWSL